MSSEDSRKRTRSKKDQQSVLPLLDPGAPEITDAGRLKKKLRSTGQAQLPGGSNVVVTCSEALPVKVPVESVTLATLERQSSRDPGVVFSELADAIRPKDGAKAEVKEGSPAEIKDGSPRVEVVVKAETVAKPDLKPKPERTPEGGNVQREMSASEVMLQMMMSRPKTEPAVLSSAINMESSSTLRPAPPAAPKPLASMLPKAAVRMAAEMPAGKVAGNIAAVGKTADKVPPKSSKTAVRKQQRPVAASTILAGAGLPPSKVRKPRPAAKPAQGKTAAEEQLASQAAAGPSTATDGDVDQVKGSGPAVKQQLGGAPNSMQQLRTSPPPAKPAATAVPLARPAAKIEPPAQPPVAAAASTPEGGLPPKQAEQKQPARPRGQPSAAAAASKSAADLALKQAKQREPVKARDPPRIVRPQSDGTPAVASKPTAAPAKGKATALKQQPSSKRPGTKAAAKPDAALPAQGSQANQGAPRVDAPPASIGASSIQQLPPAARNHPAEVPQPGSASAAALQEVPLPPPAAPQGAGPPAPPQPVPPPPIAAAPAGGVVPPESVGPTQPLAPHGSTPTATPAIPAATPPPAAALAPAATAAPAAAAAPKVTDFRPPLSRLSPTAGAAIPAAPEPPPQPLEPAPAPQSDPSGSSGPDPEVSLLDSLAKMKEHSEHLKHETEAVEEVLVADPQQALMASATALRTGSTSLGTAVPSTSGDERRGYRPRKRGRDRERGQGAGAPTLSPLPQGVSEVLGWGPSPSRSSQAVSPSRSLSIPDGPTLPESPKDDRQEAARVVAACEEFEGLLDTLTRTRESISHRTWFAVQHAPHGGAAALLRLIAERISEAEGIDQRIDLFFLVDSILQISSRPGKRGDTGPGTVAGQVFPRVVAAALARLSTAMATEHDARSKAIKCLGIWRQKQLLPEAVLEPAMVTLATARDQAPPSPKPTTRGHHHQRPSLPTDDKGEVITELQDQYGSLGGDLLMRLKDDDEGDDWDDEGFDDGATAGQRRPRARGDVEMAGAEGRPRSRQAGFGSEQQSSEYGGGTPPHIYPPGGSPLAAWGASTEPSSGRTSGPESSSPWNGQRSEWRRAEQGSQAYGQGSQAYGASNQRAAGIPGLQLPGEDVGRPSQASGRLSGSAASWQSPATLPGPPPMPTNFRPTPITLPPPTAVPGLQAATPGIPKTPAEIAALKARAQSLADSIMQARSAASGGAGRPGAAARPSDGLPKSTADALQAVSQRLAGQAQQQQTQQQQRPPPPQASTGGGTPAAAGQALRPVPVQPARSPTPDEDLEDLAYVYGTAPRAHTSAPPGLDDDLARQLYSPAAPGSGTSQRLPLPPSQAAVPGVLPGALPALGGAARQAEELRRVAAAASFPPPDLVASAGFQGRPAGGERPAPASGGADVLMEHAEALAGPHFQPGPASEEEAPPLPPDSPSAELPPLPDGPPPLPPGSPMSDDGVCGRPPLPPEEEYQPLPLQPLQPQGFGLAQPAGAQMGFAYGMGAEQQAALAAQQQQYMMLAAQQQHQQYAAAYAGVYAPGQPGPMYGGQQMPMQPSQQQAFPAQQPMPMPPMQQFPFY